MTLPNTMTAAILTGFGGPENLVLAERPVPEPRDHEILVKLAAATVNSADIRIRTRTYPKGFGLLASLVFGFRKPRVPILGAELSGTVVAVGRSATRFVAGDEIIAMPGFGSHQQYRAIAETKPIVKKPENLSFEQAAALSFGGTTALYFLRRAMLQAGEKILVIGGSGTVGSALVQLARHMGAEVTAATSAPNMELAQNLGAKRVIDYHYTDYTTEHAAYDVIADTAGVTSLDACLDALKPGGRFLGIAASLPGMLRQSKGGKRNVTGTTPERTEDLQYLTALAAQGIYTPLIDSVFPLSEIAKAHTRAASGLKRGSVVVTMP
ncbi:NAD(P)-dependent alcohol dehydrogenase [Pelagibacterium limicola]|uniref:NAD(P)-dependent alcohol dehydrogenase n=1 Tax=Pelagibacterium limicola TaxID=2791022 RepID=UPI0018AF66AC|nr:NAD(P)-dependent alcohol dehydrogenase [Pelagibacterium limicola]